MLNRSVVFYTYRYIFVYRGVKKVYHFVLRICHTWMIQIIKLILILHKDNPSKYKM